MARGEKKMPVSLPSLHIDVLSGKGRDSLIFPFPTPLFAWGAKTNSLKHVRCFLFSKTHPMIAEKTQTFSKQ